MFSVDRLPSSEKRIKLDEGFRTEMYKDGNGHWSIGYGRNLEKGISEAVADLMFREDMNEARAECLKFTWYRGLSTVRQAAIENLMFNLGASVFREFKKMIAAIEKNDWHTAANELMLDSSGKNPSPYSVQVGPRANRVAVMFVSDQWPE